MLREHLVERALRDDLAAMDAGAGAHVDDVIGGADRILVMLDDDHGVAEIAQAPERVEQPVVVALVEADRWARRARRARPTGREPIWQARRMRWLSPPDSVPLGAIEVEIIEPDIVEEAEPLDDLLEDALGDLASAGR